NYPPCRLPRFPYTTLFRSVPGVRSANVSLDALQASVRWAEGAEQNTQAVIHAVEEAGYGAKVLDAHIHDHSEHKVAGWHLNLWRSEEHTSELQSRVDLVCR